MSDVTKERKTDFLRSETNSIPPGFSYITNKHLDLNYKPITQNTAAKLHHRYRVDLTYVRFGNKLLHKGDTIMLSYVDKKGFYFTVEREV